MSSVSIKNNSKHKISHVSRIYGRVYIPRRMIQTIYPNVNISDFFHGSNS